MDTNQYQSQSQRERESELEHPQPMSLAPESNSNSFSANRPPMSYATNDALSLKAMTQRFYSWFKESGMLSALQTQFRAQIIQQIPRRHLIQTQAAVNAEITQDVMRLTKNKNEVTIMQRMVNSLIVEYFIEFDYPFALSIFGPESGTRSSESGQLTRDDILRLLRLVGANEDETQSSNTWMAQRVQQAFRDEGEEEDKENRISFGNIRENYDSHQPKVVKRSKSKPSWTKHSILAILLDAIATQPKKPLMRESNCQTDEPQSTSHSIDFKLKTIDDEYLQAHLQEREALFPTLQEKMWKYEKEQNEKFKIEFETEKKRYQEQELSRMKLEERQRYRADEEKLRRELRKEHEIHLNRIRKEQEEVIAKYQLKERELNDQLFRERQILQENMNLLHNREVELSRKREVMEKTQVLSESKIKETERLLSTRSLELEYLSTNLQRKIEDEVDRVKKDYEYHIKKRDELLSKDQESINSLTERLTKKSEELSETTKTMNAYAEQLRQVTESKQTLESTLATSEHERSLQARRIQELEARRISLEESVLKSTAKEQICFQHSAELNSIRQRLQEQGEAHEEALKKLREKHAAEMIEQHGQAQTALALEHQQASVIVSQWKNAYAEVSEEVEKRRQEEENLKQTLEEKELYLKEITRELLELKKRSGAALYPTHSLSSTTVPTVRPNFPDPSASSTIPLSSSSSYFKPAIPTLSLPNLPPPITSSQPSQPFQSISPSNAATSVPPTTTIVAPLPETVAASASATAALDAELFQRQTELEAESADLQHQLQIHAAHTSATVGVEQRTQEREETVKANTERNLALTNIARDYHQQIVLPSLPEPASPEPQLLPTPAAIESTPITTTVPATAAPFGEETPVVKKIEKPISPTISPKTSPRPIQPATTVAPLTTSSLTRTVLPKLAPLSKPVSLPTIHVAAAAPEEVAAQPIEEPKVPIATVEPLRVETAAVASVAPPVDQVISPVASETKYETPNQPQTEEYDESANERFWAKAYADGGYFDTEKNWIPYPDPNSIQQEDYGHAAIVLEPTQSSSTAIPAHVAEVIADETVHPPQVESEPVYDESATEKFWAQAYVDGGYYDATGNWIVYQYPTEPQPTTTTEPTESTITTEPIESSPPNLPQEYDDAISEASAVISAPPTDNEEF